MTSQQSLFWSGFAEGHLLAWAWFGWAWVLFWLFLAVSVSTWATVPAVISAVFWAVLVQEFIIGRR